MKAPKKDWQIQIRSILDKRGMTLADLAEEMGESPLMVRKVMGCSQNLPTLSRKVCDYLGVEYKE